MLDEKAAAGDRIVVDTTVIPHPFETASDLMTRCEATGRSIDDLLMENEEHWRSATEVREGLLRLWGVMQECVAAGIANEGVLPGGLKVRRRAPDLARALAAELDSTDPMRAMDWVNLFALAVNEQNASGGRVVTAPTNGAAGIIPAVLHYYTHFVPGADDDGVVRFLLTAGAIGMIYKQTASISGAEVGCQGEVGSAA